MYEYWGGKINEILLIICICIFGIFLGNLGLYKYILFFFLYV